MRHTLYLITLFLFIIHGCMMMPPANEKFVSSPDGKIKLAFTVDEGTPKYRVSYKDQVIIEDSPLGFIFQNMEPMTSGFNIQHTEETRYNETWETVWGHQRKIRNHYNELTVQLIEDNPGRKMELAFRVFNDGVGFRYIIPQQNGIDSIKVWEEETAFNFAADHSVWYQPCDTTVKSWEDGYNSYERLYQNQLISEVSTLMHTPATFELKDGPVVSIHEANLTNYSSMVLKTGPQQQVKAGLVPWPDGVKVRTNGTLTTPWRVIMIGDTPGDLAESNIVLNLNEPSKIEDTSWIKPMKYIGIWWEMHLNKSTWFAGPNHGATTDNTKKYIDFAAENGFGGVLVEGWNTGWETWTTNPNFDFTTPYPDYDLPLLARYAAQKGVELIGHHETSGDVLAYQNRMDEAFDLLEAHDMNALKTGYVGAINPKGQHHHGQWMVNHYRRVVEIAAAHKVCVVAHEPIKPTGLRRTYPNMLSREAVRGMEYNAWSTGNPPEHTTILPFTMLLAGPLDYTPGIFKTNLEEYRKGNSIHTTLANQLALYVVIYSPVQMAADLPEHYTGNKAFKFIKDVPTDWQETKVLSGEIGDYAVIARKDRNSEDWYIGAITDEEARTLKVSLDFLDTDQQYTTEIYADAENISYTHNASAVSIRKCLVSSEQTLTMALAPGGGQAIRFTPATAYDTQHLKPYAMK